MRILVTNDDSVSASGLLPLVRFCQTLGDVTVVVPKFEQSGKSHGIELHKSFECKQVQLCDDVTVWTVDSTPADCVRFAILGLEIKFDLVISGINRGYNIGADQIYSGTVGAACEAVALGVPAVALSTSPAYYPHAHEQLEKVWNFITEKKLLEMHPLYNVNIPLEPKGICLTRQGDAYFTDSFDKLDDTHYKQNGYCIHVNQGDLTVDTDATISGYVSVTPLSIRRDDRVAFELASKNLK